MSDNDPSAADPLGQIADEFVEAIRRGERPTVEEFARRYPEHADDLRDMLPALALMEKAKSGDDTAGEQRQAKASAAAPPLRQLGDYEILREVGRGGMGVVYEAQQLSLGRHVAIKVLPSHALLHPRQLGRFQREARSAARLHHTNIVPVFGVGEQDGLHYYVMQFIPGLGLDEVLCELLLMRQPRGKPAPTQADAPGGPANRTRDVSAADVARGLLSGEFHPPGPGGDLRATLAEPAASSSVRPADTTATIRLPGQSQASTLSESGGQYWQSVARIGLQVAGALAYAASQGVLHRDIKPSNLLLDDTGNVWVTDFGLAKATSDGDNLTHTGDVIGTLRYMAPERFNGQGDVRSDVYSLGLTLYELLALRPAFDEADRNKLVKRVMHDEPVRPRKLNRAVPRDLETVVLKAIARDPTHRYQTPADMADDLKRFVEDRPVRARRVSEAEKFLRWCRRNPLVASLLAGIVLVFLAGFAGVFWQWRAAETAREDEKGQRGRADALRQGAEAALVRERAEHTRAEAALWDSQHQLALNYTQRGVALFEAGKMELGLAWLERGLRATPAGDPIRDGTRNLIAGWARSSGLTLPHEGPVVTVAFSKDGSTAVTGSSDKTARLWDAQTGAPRGAAMGHGDRVAAVALSPNGDVVLTGSWDKTARFWDAHSGTPRGAPLPHQDRVVAVAFSPDGETAITCSWDKTARLWDVRTGESAGEPLRHDGPVVAAAFSPDGRLVLTGSYDRTARSWDARTGLPRGVTLRHKDLIRAVAYSPDGTTLLTASNDNTARLWDATTGKPRGEPLRHEERVAAVAFSPDGKTAITGTFDETARLWDAATSVQRGKTLRHQGAVVSVGFSPDGKTAVTGSFDNTARLWDAATGEPRALPAPHEGVVYAAAFHPDGKTLLVGCWGNKARLWDATGASRRKSLRHDGGVAVALFSPDGRSVLTASNNTARLWDAATGQPRGRPLRHDDIVRDGAFSPDGQTVATAGWDRTLRLWSAVNGEPVGAPMRHEDKVHAVVFSPDGKTLLTASADKTVRLWDVSSGRARGEPMRHEDEVHAVAFGPDGRTVLTGSDDKTARLWDTATEEPRTAPLRHEDIVRAVAFSPDGQTVLTGSRDKTARLWDVHTGAPRCPPLRHEKAVNVVAFSPDGRLALTGGDDNTARLWDAATGAPRGAPLRHRDTVRTAAFSPDGQTVITASWDNTAGLWDAATGEPRGLHLPHRAPLLRVAFSPDGKTILTASDDKTARLWDFPPAVADEAERIRLWVEVQTGQTWDSNGVLRTLTFQDWAARRQRLIEQGGAPIPWRRQEGTAPD